MNNTTTVRTVEEDIFMNNGIVVVDAGDGCLEAAIIKMKEVVTGIVKKKKKEEQELQRIEKRKLLQRQSVSISSLLKSLSEKEKIRHEEYCRAILEGFEDDDEDNDDENDDDDDSIEKTTISLSELSMALTDLDDSDSNSDIDSDSNYNTQKGDQQIEQQRRRRQQNVFQRMKRRWSKIDQVLLDF